MAKSKIHTLIISAMCTAFIAVCSYLTVPGTVPFTMQTFALYSILCLFGAKTAFRAIGVYIIIGALGVPVFAGFKSGFGVLFGPVGGYIIGFLLIAAVYALYEKKMKDKFLSEFLSLFVGTLLCYAFGTAWFMAVYTKTSGPIGLFGALTLCVFPFIIPDTTKLVLALLIKKKVKPILNKYSHDYK